MGDHLAVIARGALAPSICERWSATILRARHAWTEDFDGEQHALGRAFYTHLETDRTDLYFADAASSDARVEEHAPGLQAVMRGLLGDALTARVVTRRGWCGAGVHVFSPGSVVARHGGVRHFDTEGLVQAHVERRAPAVSLVAMLRPPGRGGGLRLWPVSHAGRDQVADDELPPEGDAVIEFGAGDVVLFDSYRLHQIQPFGGDEPRISATLHGAEIDLGLWETWF
jgi:hypothetical protein